MTKGFESDLDIDLIELETELSNKAPILVFVSEILTIPSILDSKTSNWAVFSVTSPPSETFKVNPFGKLAKVFPYLSIISCSSEALPVTTSCILPISLKAISSVRLDHVDLFVLLKFAPDKAPIYWSQVISIDSESLVLVIPLM